MKMKRVLVIDDSITITGILRSYLADEGFDVITAGNGNEGIKMIEEYHPDLVITDIIMPERNGIEVVMHLKFHHPEIRIIAISSGGTITAREHLANIQKLGADYILEKPFTRDEILSAAKGVISLVES